MRAQCFAMRRVVSQIGVAGFHGARKFQVAKRVFVGAAHPGVARQRGELVQRGQHLRRRAFEQAPAAAGEQRVAAEEQRRASPSHVGRQ